MENNIIDNKSNIIFYTTDDGQVKIEVRLEEENVWITQNAMAELFDTTKQNISGHIQNIFEEGELKENSTVKEFLTVQKEGNREVQRKIRFYNLELIIAVGYRVKSIRGTQFRIRDIRSSEKVFWRKILDIYATSVDYDANNELTKEFFKTIQNKMHYATHGNTAAEVIYNRVDSNKENIGLTNFKGNIPTRSETEIAKNYLTEEELKILNRMVSAYLDIAEINALSMHTMTMKDWTNELDNFLKMTRKDILNNKGKVSHEEALEKAHREYDKYMQNHLTQAEKDYLKIMGEDIKKLK